MKKITKEQLEQMSKEEIFDFIRKTLKFKENVECQLRYSDKDTFQKEHRRFEMSGYEDKTGECTLHNIAILNEFAYLGIYDYTTYLFLDFYKGHGKLYMQFFENNGENLVFDYGGEGTVGIIYDILQKTIFSGKRPRRRF